MQESRCSELFADGFSQWLGFFSKDKAKIAEAFAHMFVLEHFYVAVADRKVAGMAACTVGTDLCVKLNKKELRKAFGFFKGSMAWLFLKKEFERPPENPSPNTGSIAFVGTAVEFRGQGVASQLINHILKNTPVDVFLIDEVADTNIPAMKLYSKLGFHEYKRKVFPEKIAKKNGIHSLVSLKWVR